MPSRIAPPRPHATVVVGVVAALLVALAVWSGATNGASDAAPSRAEIGAPAALDSPAEAVVGATRAVELRRALLIGTLAAMVTVVAATVSGRHRPPSDAPKPARVESRLVGRRAPPLSRFA